MQISGHIVQHLKLEKGSQNTKIPRILSKISTMEPNFTALSNRTVALKMTRISSYVTSTLWMILKNGSPFGVKALRSVFFYRSIINTQ